MKVLLVLFYMLGHDDDGLSWQRCCLLLNYLLTHFFEIL